ncbi:MAG: DUF1064 domain-containing protein [Proteobacteria bacterium]|nr:DUF1064 domain-containing protein [Pseudomonadota bacterium]
MNKYRNKPKIIDDIRFASIREANRYLELKLLKRAGEIQDLELQPSFDFPIKYESGRKIRYVADFRYIDCDTAKVIVEDVKGVHTPVYKIKKAMLRYFHGINVIEL